MQSRSEGSRSFSDFASAHDHGKSLAAHLGNDLVEAICIADVEYRFLRVGELVVGDRVLVEVDGVLVEEPVVSVALFDRPANTTGRCTTWRSTWCTRTSPTACSCTTACTNFAGPTSGTFCSSRMRSPTSRRSCSTRTTESTQTILDAANAVIDNNLERKPKSLWTDTGMGDRIVRYHAEDEGDEAIWVAGTASNCTATTP